jgi:hypothetical protein
MSLSCQYVSHRVLLITLSTWFHFWGILIDCFVQWQWCTSFTAYVSSYIHNIIIHYSLCFLIGCHIQYVQAHLCSLLPLKLWLRTCAFWLLPFVSWTPSVVQLLRWPAKAALSTLQWRWGAIWMPGWYNFAVQILSSQGGIEHPAMKVGSYFDAWLTKILCCINRRRSTWFGCCTDQPRQHQAPFYEVPACGKAHRHLTRIYTGCMGRVCPHTYTCAHTHKHTRAHTHTHTRAHTHTCSCISVTVRMTIFWKRERTPTKTNMHARTCCNLHGLCLKLKSISNHTNAWIMGIFHIWPYVKYTHNPGAYSHCILALRTHTA